MSFTIFGPNYSTYVRSVRLLFAEKGEACRLEEVNTLKGESKAPEHLARHPFGMVPAFAHDDFELYETGAILRYVDKVVEGTSFTPATPRGQARMDQLMSITDAYAYPPIIGTLVIQRLVVPMTGGQSDEAAIVAAQPRIRLVLGEYERLMGEGPFLAGQTLSLADLLLAPIMAYFVLTPDAKELMASHGRLAEWWKSVEGRAAMAETVPSLG